MVMYEPEKKIGGSENLEVMADAVHYNGFLLQQSTRALAHCKRIVDFGAGRGTFAKALKNRGFEVVCIEPEPDLITLLKAEGFETHTMLDLLPDGSVEGLYSLNVLEHIDDDEAVLRTIYDKLSYGGTFYIYVPAFQILYSSMDLRVGHVRRYRLSELLEKCRRAGFMIERSGYCDSLGFFATLAYKVFGSENGDINRSTLIIYDKYIFPVSCKLDLLFHRVFGKNLFIQCRKD